MKLYNYLEELITNASVIEDFIIPTLKNKGTFWVPLKSKYTASIQPKRIKAFHQLGINSLNKFLNIKRNVSISTFTNTNSIDKMLYQSIGHGSGLIALVEGTPIISSPKDIKSRKEGNRKWINFDKNISFDSYKNIKNDVVQKINDYLGGKEISSLNQKEKNKLISFYYKTVWDILKEKNQNNPDFYKHLSFKGPIKDLLFSKSLFFKGNRFNDMAYNEIIMNNIKIKKIYYSDTVASKVQNIEEKYYLDITKSKIDNNEDEDEEKILFVHFDADSFHIDLIEIQKQNL